ncbi:MAG: hypothetical protein H6728_16340 [Myxococcales bacterium]|nr:hypothetical protein [Myxococcales bacterium]
MFSKRRIYTGVCWLLWGITWMWGEARADVPTSRPALSSSQGKPKQKDGAVFVALERLHQLMRAPHKAAGPNWVEGRATYAGQIARKSLTLQVTREISVQQDRPVWVPLGGRGGIVRGVMIAKSPLAPKRRKDGSSWLLLSKGKHTLHYVLQLPVPKARGEHKLALELPASPQGVLQLRFQGPDWSVYTEPASQVVMTHPKGQTHAMLRLPASGKLTLHWKGKRIERDEQKRFRATIQQWVTLQERLMSVRVQSQIEVVTGSLRQIRFKVPADVEVLHVGGKGVTEWYQVGREAGSQIWLVQLGYAVREKQSLVVKMERQGLQAGKAVVLPEFQVLGAEEVNGDIGVQARADTEVSHESAQGASPVDVRSLSGAIRRGSDLPILLAYRFEQSGWSVGVRMVKHPPLKVISIVINRARFDTVYTRAGREVTKATWWVTNNRRQFMPVYLAKDAEVIGTFVAGRAVQIAETKRTQKGERLLLIPLVRSKSMSVGKNFPVEVLYTMQRAPLRMWGAFRTSLPRTTLEVLSFQWDVYLARSHRMIWQGGNVLPKHRHRLMRYLNKRLSDDLKAGTPVLWAGGGYRKGRFRLNSYSSMGLKERFAAPLANSDIAAAKSEYRSRFEQVQWQVRAEIPLVGRLISLEGHMLRNRSPKLEIFYLQEFFLAGWFWIVLLATTWLVWIFLLGCFSSQGVRWSWLFLSVVGGISLFVSGLLLPMTYLAGARGLVFGFWVALLYRLGTNASPMFPRWVVLSRWSMVFLTFAMLLNGTFGAQVVCLVLAFPILPALFGQRIRRDAKDTPPSGQGGSGAPKPEAPTRPKISASSTSEAKDAQKDPSAEKKSAEVGEEEASPQAKKEPVKSEGTDHAASKKVSKEKSGGAKKGNKR